MKEHVFVGTAVTPTAPRRSQRRKVVTLLGILLLLLGTRQGTGGVRAATVSVAISRGWNLIDIPTAGTGITNLTGLLASLNASTHGAVSLAATYNNGRYVLYVPGFTADIPLTPATGILVFSSTSGTRLEFEHTSTHRQGQIRREAETQSQGAHGASPVAEMVVQTTAGLVVIWKEVSR